MTSQHSGTAPLSLSLSHTHTHTHTHTSLPMYDELSPNTKTVGFHSSAGIDRILSSLMEREGGRERGRERERKREKGEREVEEKCAKLCMYVLSLQKIT